MFIIPDKEEKKRRIIQACDKVDSLFSTILDNKSSIAYAVMFLHFGLVLALFSYVFFAPINWIYIIIVFLIIIIIILAYLLFKGKNTSGEKIKKETKKYGKALKEAANTFQKTVQEEDKISKEDMDNLSDTIKVGVMATTTIMEALYQPVR